MTDYTELKRLAEAATPGRNFDRLPMAGGGLKYECTGDDGSLVLKVDHKNNEWGFVGDNSAADEEFFLACTPAEVLALIAESARLQSAAKTLERLGYRDNGGELWKPPLGQKPDFSLMDQLKAENDQLFGETERLKAEVARSTERENLQLAEIEALRKAFRPLLAHWDDLKAGESLNVDAARAAMGKGEQS